jgi:ERCC4-type nuclease
MIVEGEDGFDVLGIPPNALRGVLLTLLVGYRIPLLRTASLSETAVTLAHLARQEQKRVGRLGNGGGQPTAGKTALEILGAIPGIGDEKARRLISGLGTLRRVALASEEELRSVPGIGPGTVRELGRALDEPP